MMCQPCRARAISGRPPLMWCEECNHLRAALLTEACANIRPPAHPEATLDRWAQ